MTAAGVLAEALAAGILLRLDEAGAVRVTGRAAPDLLARLRQNKAGLAALLAEPPPRPARPRKPKAAPNLPAREDVEGWRARLREALDAGRSLAAKRGVVAAWLRLWGGDLDAAGRPLVPAGLPDCPAADALRSACAYYWRRDGKRSDAVAPESGPESSLAAEPSPVVEELLWAGMARPVTIVRTAPPEAAALEAARTGGQRAWPLGRPVVEHVYLRRAERWTVPGGEVVVRLHLHDGTLLSRGPLAPLLVVGGHVPIRPPDELAGEALWAELRRQAEEARKRRPGTSAGPGVLFLPPPPDPPHPASGEGAT